LDRPLSLKPDTSTQKTQNTLASRFVSAWSGTDLSCLGQQWAKIKGKVKILLDINEVFTSQEIQGMETVIQ